MNNLINFYFILYFHNVFCLFWKLCLYDNVRYAKYSINIVELEEEQIVNMFLKMFFVIKMSHDKTSIQCQPAGPTGPHKQSLVILISVTHHRAILHANIKPIAIHVQRAPLLPVFKRAIVGPTRHLLPHHFLSPP